MKYIQIQNYLNDLKIFSIIDLKLIDDNFNKSKIFNWKKKWYIKQIIRWFYVYWNCKINQILTFQISNKIYTPSYISLESAFSYYGIIPEQSFIMTWITTNKTINFNTDFWYFEYRKLKPILFWWYDILNIGQNKILIAELEKSILDYFYLNSNIKTIDDLYWLRFNKDLLKEKLNIKKIKKYAKIFGKKNIDNQVDLLLKYIKDDQSSIY